MKIILVTCVTALLLASIAILTYQFFTFRQSTLQHISTLGQIIASNSTSALASDDAAGAKETLTALQAEKPVVAAGLYDGKGRLFAVYPAHLAATDFPAAVQAVQEDRYRFAGGYLTGFQPVVRGGTRLGTLFIKSDVTGVYQHFAFYFGTVALIISGSFLLAAYSLSKTLQQQISQPILALAETARAVSDAKDYSVRAAKLRDDELGSLTDAFNHMLTEINEQTGALRKSEARLQIQLSRLELLHRITRAIAERHDLPSIFQVMIRRLEDDLPIDFGCVCLYEPNGNALTVASIGMAGETLARELCMMPDGLIPVDQDGLSNCVRGELVHEPDAGMVSSPFAQRLAKSGLRSLVAAPLVVHGKVFGVLFAARRAPHSFSSGECEFLRHLSEQVALAAHQVSLYGALQQAYNDLRQTQETAMQQERLKALGQMASGIAHDINNSISPVALYTDALLEREPGLSARARDYLATIRQAIEDVALTVSRMREFYRSRDPEPIMSPIDLGRIVRQVVDLTRPRWKDVPQQRGIDIHLQVELLPGLPEILGVESELRDALTNLIFNAVDAMPDGGTLTIRTWSVGTPGPQKNGDPDRFVQLEVCDTGSGMDEETKRRCVEPFFTTKGERGTGLGLAMVYGMAQRHGGEIEIESTPGQGTTVRVVFPAMAPVSVLSFRAPAAGPPAKPLRILLVDDDPLIIKTLRDILESDGHIVSEATGGEAGIRAFQAACARDERFAAVITDLGMPGIDGRKVAAAVKAASPDTPVVLLTGWGQRLVAEHDIPPNVDKVLGKPPRLQDLRAALRDVTHQRLLA